VKTCFAHDRTFVALGVGCALIACLWAAPASAQVGRPAPQGKPRGGGVLEKLESFQTSVKHRLKTALGVEPESSGSGRGEPRAQRVVPPTGRATTTADRQATAQTDPQPHFEPTIRDLQPGWEGGGEAIVRQAAGMQPAAEPAGLPPVAVAAAEVGTVRGQPPVPAGDATHRATDYRQVAGEMPRYGSSAEPLPPPMPDPNASPSSQWNDQNIAATPTPQPAPARRSAGTPNSVAPKQSPIAPPIARAARRSAGTPNSIAPSARGTVLGGNPVTATEHALRLLEENGDLKARLAMMEAEAARLKETLAETQTMLQRSTVAIEQAKQEIDALVTENRQLTGKLREAETRYNRHLMETDRMLQSIRDELDDALVREISATGR
jgi:hypothetical protein